MARSKRQVSRRQMQISIYGTFIQLCKPCWPSAAAQALPNALNSNNDKFIQAGITLSLTMQAWDTVCKENDWVPSKGLPAY